MSLDFCTFSLSWREKQVKSHLFLLCRENIHNPSWNRLIWTNPSLLCSSLNQLWLLDASLWVTMMGTTRVLSLSLWRKGMFSKSSCVLTYLRNFFPSSIHYNTSVLAGRERKSYYFRYRTCRVQKFTLELAFYLLKRTILKRYMKSIKSHTAFFLPCSFTPQFALNYRFSCKSQQQ